MSNQFQIFDAVLRKRGRKWAWAVCTSEGKVVMQGLESNRLAANYEANKALLLLLLSASYRPRLSAGARVRVRR
jgi:hypothetical protein